MNKALVAAGVATLILVVPAATASAQEASPPTTVDVDKTVVVATSLDVRTTRDVETVDTNGDDDDNTGLWGLLGLLGLIGLAGLAGRKRSTPDVGTAAPPVGTTTTRGKAEPPA